MVLSEFKELDTQHQIWVFAGGIKVGRCEEDGIIAECRQVDDFYVECEIDSMNNFRCFMFSHRNTRLLDRYFDRMPALDLAALLVQ